MNSAFTEDERKVNRPTNIAKSQPVFIRAVGWLFAMLVGLPPSEH
jgi:hypothetical protein